jgi:hypothetical protein
MHAGQPGLERGRCRRAVLPLPGLSHRQRHNERTGTWRSALHDACRRPCSWKGRAGEAPQNRSILPRRGRTGRSADYPDPDGGWPGHRADRPEGSAFEPRRHIELHGGSPRKPAHATTPSDDRTAAVLPGPRRRHLWGQVRAGDNTTSGREQHLRVWALRTPPRRSIDRRRARFGVGGQKQTGQHQHSKVSGAPLQALFAAATGTSKAWTNASRSLIHRGFWQTSH